MAASPVKNAEASRCPVRDDFNPFTPETTADPSAAIQSVAREDPVFYNTHSQWWTVAGYDEVCEVLRDTKRFSSAASILDPIPTDRSAELAPKGAVDQHPSLINNDPPEHKRIRKLSNKAFTPKVIATWAPLVKQQITTLLDDLIGQGSCDVVSSFSVPLPIVVISEILGIPDDEPRVIEWSECILTVRLPPVDEETRNEGWRRNGECRAYLDEMIEDRRREPRDDMTSMLVHATDGDEPMLDNEEVVSVISHLLIAGNETTRHLISTLVLRLTQEPELVTRLVDNEELAEQIVEEELRAACPARGLFRVATEDVTLGGATIRAGDRLQICFAAANHDQRMFENPSEFKLDRPNLNRHLAFGRGEHFCIGAPLARLEAKIAIMEIAARLPNLRRADDKPLSWQPNVIITGLNELNVRWDVPGQ